MAKLGDVMKIPAAVTIITLQLSLALASCDIGQKTKTFIKTGKFTESPKQAGQLTLQEQAVNAVIEALVKSTELGGAGMTADQILPIKTGGLQLPQAVSFALNNNYNPADLSQAIPVVAKQAVAAISDSDTGLSQADRKITVAALINTTLIKFMGNHVASLTDADSKNKLPGLITAAAIGSLDEGGIDKQYLANAMTEIAAGAVGSLDDAGFTDASQLNAMFKDFSTSALQAFKEAGINGISQYESIADNFMTGAISAFDEAGLTETDGYESAMGQCIEGAMVGLKNSGVAGESLLSLYDNIIEGSLAGITGISDIQASKVPSIAGSLNTVSIAFIDDLGFTTSKQFQTASQLIATGTMRAIGDFDSSFMGISDIQASTKQITEAAMNAIVDHQKNLFTTESVIGDLSKNLCEGISAGLAAAGWKRGDINAAATYIKNGTDAALVDETNYEANSIWTEHMVEATKLTTVEARAMCSANTGTWDTANESCAHPAPANELPPGVTPNAPTASESQSCEETGGMIEWLSDGNWICVNHGAPADSTVVTTPFCEYGQTVCIRKPECEWNGSNCSSRSSGCEIRFDQASCSVEPGCAFDDNFQKCMPSSAANSDHNDWCKLYSNEASCKTYEGQCSWNENACSLRPAASFNGNQTGCELAGYLYAMNLCIETPGCTSTTLDQNESFCNAAGCLWKGSYCEPHGI